MQGTVNGGRRRGRQKKRWDDNIREWTGFELRNTLRKAEDREEWKAVVRMLRPDGSQIYGIVYCFEFYFRPYGLLWAISLRSSIDLLCQGVSGAIVSESALGSTRTATGLSSSAGQQSTSWPDKDLNVWDCLFRGLGEALVAQSTENPP
ncbi:UDP-glucuronosyltransferase 2a1-like [Plakobranchus ocellatus]|uniref:UDP-glucuronosyltransferase 2a1-like n=1 Tax=Plakobranchus ocellatus TaxID=259542 RepID=A0AAV4B034_9GAST|nr:UDP-glucuronosyltransferase 2a1-like [Plakobranchus ocellatus]